MTLERDIEIKNEHGLHLRAAAEVAKTSCKFESEIKFMYKDRTADAKSTVGLITLGAARSTRVTVRACGDDADGALEAICAVLSSDLISDESPCRS